MGIVVLASVSRADAQTTEPSTTAVAQALFEQARSDMKRGAFPAACPKLEESQRLDPSNGTLLNLVLCDASISKIASAWLHARELVDRLARDDDRRPIAERELAELYDRLPRLAVRLDAAASLGASVTLDGIELRPSSLGVPIPIDPGSHVLVVRVPGRPEQITRLSIEEAQQLDWIATLPPPESHDDVRPERLRPPAPIKPTDPPGPARWVSWTMLGLGTAALVTSGIFAVLALDRRSTVLAACPQKQCGDASALGAAAEGQRFFVGSFAALGVGIVGSGLGTYFLTQSGSRPRNPSPMSMSARAPILAAYSLHF